MIVGKITDFILSCYNISGTQGEKQKYISRILNYMFEYKIL